MHQAPWERHYDVAVIGGGLGGVAAALRAAQEGKQVLLVERRTALAWEVTWALEGLGEPSGQPEGALARGLMERMEAMGGYRRGRLDAVILELLLDRLLEEASVDLLLYSTPVRLLHDGERALGVVVGNKSGEQVLHAHVFVDATENAFLWRQAEGGLPWPSPTRGKQVIVFNGLPKEVEEVEALGARPEAGVLSVVLRPSAWEGEAFLEFVFEPFSPLVARQRAVEVLRWAREQRPFLAEGVVSQTGHEPYPLGVPRVEAEDFLHPHLCNLVGAGVWIRGEEANTVAGRWSLGEEAGARAASLQVFVPPEAAREAKGSLLLPPPREADVVVVGGGTAGAIAAIAAGRQGVQVALLEAGPFLGGIGTGGGIHFYYHGVRGGIQEEVDERVRELTPLWGHPHRVVGFHPEAKKVVLQEMALEAGVEILLHTTVTGVQVEEEHPAPSAATELQPFFGALPRRFLRSVVAAGPEGSQVYSAKAFVDATGDGDVAAMAGAPFLLGREKDGLTHAYSLAAGRMDERGRLSFLNFDAGYVDATDVVDLTRARRVGLRHYWRQHFTPEDRLLYIAPLLGLRQSRQILGEYQITLMDEIAGRRFPDAIGYTYAHYDNHALDYENESDEAVVWVWLLGQWQRFFGCQVPYRALLPRNLEGVVVACRALSLTHDAHHEFRMQRDMQRLGEAGGLAAALAARQGVPLRGIDLRELQRLLRQSGALQEEDPFPPALQPPAPPLEAPAEALVAPSSAALQGWGEALASEKPQDAVWALAHAGEAALPVLREALGSSQPSARFWAAVALALQGREEGKEELLACLRERRALVPQGRKTVPLWQSVIVLLGRIRAKEAVPDLLEVLEEPSPSLDVLLAVVRALGRIGDPSAVPALRRLLQRQDLPSRRELQTSMGGAPSVFEDARWQIDLAAAEALAALGSPQPEVVEPYLHDPRAYVRRYAAQVWRAGGG